MLKHVACRHQFIKIIVKFNSTNTIYLYISAVRYCSKEPSLCNSLAHWLIGTTETQCHVAHSGLIKVLQPQRRHHYLFSFCVHFF